MSEKKAYHFSLQKSGQHKMWCTIREWKRITNLPLSERTIRRKAVSGELGEVRRCGNRIVVRVTDEKQILMLNRLRAITHRLKIIKRKQPKYLRVYSFLIKFLMRNDLYRACFFNYIREGSFDDVEFTPPEQIYLPQDVYEKVKIIAEKNKYSMQRAFERLFELYIQSGKEVIPGALALNNFEKDKGGELS